MLPVGGLNGLILGGGLGKSGCGYAAKIDCPNID